MNEYEQRWQVDSQHVTIIARKIIHKCGEECQQTSGTCIAKTAHNWRHNVVWINPAINRASDQKRGH